MSIGKNTGREAPVYRTIPSCHDNRFISFKDIRGQAAQTLVDMKVMISRETPMISLMGNDDPTPMICYDTKSLLS